MKDKKEIRTIGSDEKTALHLDALDEDGVVIIKDALPASIRDKAIQYGQKLCELVAKQPEIFQTKDDYGIDKHLLRIAGLQMQLPIPELLLPERIEPLICQIFARSGMSGATYGTRSGCNFQSAGMAAHILLSGGEQRPLHRDIEPLFRGKYPNMPAYSVAMHIPVTEFNDLSGGTRIATGTQFLTVDPVKSGLGDLYEQMACTVKASPGDIILFDNRVWHASGRNTGQNARAMLSVVFAAEWLGSWRTFVSRRVHEALSPMAQKCFTVEDGILDSNNRQH